MMPVAGVTTIWTKKTNATLILMRKVDVSSDSRLFSVFHADKLEDSVLRILER